MEHNNGSLKEVERLYNIYKEHPHICIDSRILQAGDIFFALKGERFDGNDFAIAAAERGAAAVVFDSEKILAQIGETNAQSVRANAPFARTNAQDKFFFCQDSLMLLQELAAYHRKKLSTTIIGISGTNGKTTTKELISTVLQTKFRTFATKGNLNNHIGVPLSLLEIEPQTEVAVIEMGANHPGEIAFLCGIAKPDMGILTNIGTAHIEGFLSRENIIKTKKALFESVKGSGSKRAHLFVNCDDEALKDETFSAKTTYSFVNPSDYRAEFEQTNCYATMRIEGERIQSQLVGAYNGYNMLAAYVIGRTFGVEKEQIKQAIEAYRPKNQRSQVLQTQNNTLILDCYNANPSSCKAAVEALANMEAKRKMVFMGAMRELGNVSQREHKACFELMKSKNFERIILVGDEYREFSGGETLWFASSEALRDYLAKNPITGATILIKGSRTTKMELVKDVL